MIGIAEIDIILSANIQAIGEGFLPIMTFFTRIGEASLYIFIGVVVCWCWDYGLGARLGSLLSFSALINGMLKLIIRAPRPYVVDERIIPREMEHGLGMPSGHAQVAATMWAYLAGRYKHISLWIIGFAMSFFIGISRVYLGVHSLGQVLVGWIVGILLVLAFITLERTYGTWFLRQPVSLQITSVIGVALLPVALVRIFSGEATGAVAEQIPRLLMFSGMFSGFAIGGLIFSKRGMPYVRAIWWKQLIKICLALLTVMLYGVGIGAVMKSLEQAWLSGGILLLMNFLLGIWVTYLAPILFVKLQLITCKKKSPEFVGIVPETQIAREAG